MDTVDKRRTQQWLDNLEKVLDGRTPDYLVVSHLEPDHASNIQLLAEKYPDMQVVSNPKVFSMLPQFFTLDFTPRSVVVKEGDTSVWENIPCSSLWHRWSTGRKSWWNMNRQKRFIFSRRIWKIRRFRCRRRMGR